MKTTMSILQKKAIICIDDEIIVLQSLRNQLEDAFGLEYLIEVAESGQEALEVFNDLRLRNYEIPVVICDYIIPGMNGDEILMRIHKLSPNTMKILLTGQAGVQGVINTINCANLFEYIEKPWTKSELNSAVKRAIESYENFTFSEEENRKLTEINNLIEKEIYQKNANFYGLQKELNAKCNESKQEILDDIRENLHCISELSMPLEKVKCSIRQLDSLSNAAACKEVDVDISTMENIKDLQKRCNQELDQLIEKLNVTHNQNV